MKLLSPTISKLLRIRFSQIEEWIEHPIEAQRQVLQDLVTHGQYTAFGRKHGFSSLFTVRKFKEAVPIHTYDEIKPFIEKAIEGQENMLWNTPANWFAKSSGTTSDKSKFIPITKESLEDCHYQAAKDVLTLYYNARPQSDLLTGKGLVIGGSHQLSSLNEDVQLGDLSAVLLQNAPFYGQLIRTPDLAIALLDEWEQKIESLAHSTIPENVTSISGVPTWTLVLVKRILEITGAKQLTDVWPNLEVYIHGGVSFTPYKQQFQQLLGGQVQYLEMYNASEGFFAAQDSPDANGMLLFTNHGIFYEFMPMDELDKPNPATIGLQKVELHKNYALVISTNGGLWRYLVGDTIQFTCLQPYRIIVTGRTKQFMNAFGEEVMVNNTDEAIAFAAADCNVVIADYTAAPKYFSEEGKGGHEWIIEFETPPNNLAHFTTLLDTKLQALNSDYEAKRYKNIALEKPLIHVAPPGTFHNWLKQKGKLGGQHKVPRLSNNRQYLEEILGLL